MTSSQDEPVIRDSRRIDPETGEPRTPPAEQTEEESEALAGEVVDEPAEQPADGRLQEELDLTAEQTDQVRAIFAEQHARFQELREEEGGDPESRREAFRQHREETHARIREVLNDEQRARLDELHAEFKEEHGPGAGGHHCPSHGDRSDNA